MSPVVLSPYQRGKYVNSGRAPYARPRWDTGKQHTLSLLDFQEFYADSVHISSYFYVYFISCAFSRIRDSGRDSRIRFYLCYLDFYETIGRQTIERCTHIFYALSLASATQLRYAIITSMYSLRTFLSFRLRIHVTIHVYYRG